MTETATCLTCQEKPAQICRGCALAHAEAERQTVLGKMAELSRRSLANKWTILRDWIVSRSEAE